MSDPILPTGFDPTGIREKQFYPIFADLKNGDRKNVEIQAFDDQDALRRAAQFYGDVVRCLTVVK